MTDPSSPQSLTCPSCNAPLQFSGADSPTTIKCAFCGATVIVPPELRSSSANVEIKQALAGLPLAKFRELKKLIQAGARMDAIKLYREITDAGLSDAVDAVDKLQRGEPLVLTTESQISVAGELDDDARQALGALFHPERAGQTNDIFSERSDARLAELMNFIRAGQNMPAIKLYRQIYGAGLKEAKEAVEKAAAGHPLPTPPPLRPASAGASQAEVTRTVGRAARVPLLGGGCLGLLGTLLGCGFMIFMLGGFPFRLSGSYKQALAAAQNDPAVVEALGAPVEASWWFIGGEISCGGGCAADYSVPIHGSQKGGWLIVSSYSTNAGFFDEGTWHLNAYVQVNNGGPMLSLSEDAAESETSDRDAPNISPAQADATAGAEARATGQAEGTATVKTETAAAEATRAAAATATAEARDATATAVVAGEQITYQQANWPVHFSDKFNAARPGWSVGPVSGEQIEGERRLADGQYTWELDTQVDVVWSTWPDTDAEYGEFYASVDGQLLADGDLAYYGLVFRRMEESTFCYFGVNGDSRYHFIFYLDGQPVVTLSGDTPTELGAGEWHTLAVSADEGEYILLVDGQVAEVVDQDLVASFSGGQSAAGQIGLGMQAFAQAGAATVIFDNFEIRAPQK